VLDDETVNKLREKFTMTNLDKRVEDAFPLINKIMSELDLKDLKPKASDVVTIGKGGSLKHIQIEYEILGTLENMLIDNSEQEVLKRIADFVTDEVGAEHVDKAMEIIEKAKENKDEEMTFYDMINILKGKKEEQVNELDPGEAPKVKDTQPTVLGKDVEPIDAPVQPPVDHGAIVQSFLTDPDSKMILRKDAAADKMLKNTKFTNKNTMLSSILGDIASRMLTKSGEEDRVANFASRVADEMEQENSANLKPTPDYMKNKKIAIQLAKRYIDDYKKMEKDPEYEKQVRMEPGEFNPKKDLKGKAKETEAFESWAENITEQKPYVSMYRDDKGKMVYDVLDKDGKSAFKSSDEELSTNFLRKNYDELMGRMAVTKADKNLNNPAYQRMKAGDDRYADKTEGMGDKIADMAQNMTRDEFMSKADELGLSQEEAAEHYEKMQGGAHAGKFEGNQFAQAVQKAKAAGMKAGDKFKVGDEEYTLKDAIELAGLQLEEFYSEEEIAYDNQIDRIKNLAHYK